MNTQNGAKAASRQDLRAALGEANIPTLLMALAQLTGEARWLEPPNVPGRPKGAGDHDSGGLPSEVQRSIREAALEAALAWRKGTLTPADPPSPRRIAEMLAVSFGLSQEIDPEYGPLLAEELGVADRDAGFGDLRSADDFRVLVIGSGFSGLCAAIKLQRAGIAYTVVEKNSAVGGTWLENRYPGCGVDTPSHLYSFSFAPRADWSRYFAKRDELHSYLEELADEHDVRPNIVFDSEVVSADWDAEARRWRVRTRSSGGAERTLSANVVISGVGFLNRPSFPDIEGFEDFEGPAMHTARWREDVDLRGKRVAVIGTGASAMQLVPAIAGEAGSVVVFQRSPQWGLPNPNYMRSVSPATQLVMREVPFYLGWYRLRQVWSFGDRLHPALQIDPEWPHPDRAVNEMNDRHRRFLTDYIRSELGDRTDLIDRCVPTYPPYGKRPLLDNGWFRTMARDDVELVTEDVAEVKADRVVTSAGDEFEADVLVIATGFQAVRVLGPIEVRGRSGRSLRSVWGDDDAHAYLGMSVPDFPNFFFLLGPNTFAGHGGSAALTIEMEVRYVMKLIAHMIEHGVASVECREDVHDAYDEKLEAALARTIWAHRGMTTYYRNDRGRIVVPMPWTNLEYWRMTHTPNLNDFHLEPAGRSSRAQALM